MDIPPKIKIPICIEQGSMFSFIHEPEGKGRETKHRYFIVINKEPKTDIVLLMLTPTSKVDKKRTWLENLNIDMSTLVIVQPSEYQVFTKETAFDCNEIIETSLLELIEKIEDAGCMDYIKVPQTIINRLIIGIRRSPMIEPYVKAMV